MAKKMELSQMTAEVGNYLENFVNVNNELYVFKENKWINDAKEIEVFISSVLHNFEDNATNRDTKEVMNKLLALGEKREISKNVVAFKNCSYDFDKGTINKNVSLIPTNVVNLNYKTLPEHDEKIVNTWRKFFNNLMDEDSGKCDTLYQILGDIIEPVRKNEVAIFFIGKHANNGKTTLNNLISECLGFENCSDVKLENYGDNNKTFARAPMINKLVNFEDECKSSYIPSEMLKTISGNGNISVEAKNKNARSVKLNATLIHNCNNLPSFDFNDSGILRRLRFLNFDVKFGEEHYEEWKEMSKVLSSEEGLECLLSIMISSNIEFKGKIENTELSRSLLETAKIDKVFELVFFEEMCEQFTSVSKAKLFLGLTEREHFDIEDPLINKTKLFEAYRNWCKEAQVKAINRIYFLKTLEKHGKIEVVKYNKRDGKYTKGAQLLKLNIGDEK